MDIDDVEITQDDSWHIISSYFKEKGLVRQQLDSFDEFIQKTKRDVYLNIEKIRNYYGKRKIDNWEDDTLRGEK